MNKEAILKYAKDYDSFYFYDKKKILESINTLKDKFEGVEFLYSMKTNTYIPIVETILPQGFGADAASLKEVEIANETNVSPEMIQYSAPGKTAYDIENAIEISTITADSVNEVKLIDEVAGKKGLKVKIGVRLNPDFTFDGDKPMPSKFGIDADTFFKMLPEFKELKNIEIVGIHTHLKSQELNENAIVKYYEKVFAFSDRVKEALGKNLEFINLGSGIGITYAPSDTPVNLDVLGKTASEMVKKYKETSPETRIIIETGRFLVGKAGTYVTKVLDKKVSWGKTFIILHNTLTGFIRPVLSFAFEKFYGEGEPFAYEPLYTKKDSFEIVPLTDEKEMETVNLAGNLCTATDAIAVDISLPKLKVGDVIAFTNAGAYSAVVTPMQFSSQRQTIQILSD